MGMSVKKRVKIGVLWFYATLCRSLCVCVDCFCVTPGIFNSQNAKSVCMCIIMGGQNRREGGGARPHRRGRGLNR